MKSTLSNVLLFAAGAAVGSAVTWKLLKTKYERIANEEIESVKEVYARKAEETSCDEPTPRVAKPREQEEAPKSVKEYYEEVVKEENYFNYSKGEPAKKEVDDVEKPYIINPSEFGEIDGYEVITLFKFADGYLTDDDNEILDDPDELVGTEYADHFGDYEDDPDSVYVRNDARRTDYEILLDERKYTDVKPYFLASDDEV